MKLDARWTAAVVLALAGVTLSVEAVTIHRSFRPREAGFGFGTGTATVVHPVDAKIDQALDEARKKESERVKVVIGKATSVQLDNSIHVVTDANVLFRVCLDGVMLPLKGQPGGKEANAALSKMIRGKTIRVEWVKKDRFGRLLGTVFLDKVNVNEKMVGMTFDSPETTKNTKGQVHGAVVGG